VWYQLEIHLQRLREYRHVVRRILFVVSQLLAKKYGFLIIDSALKNGDTEKDLTSLRYRKDLTNC